MALDSPRYFRLVALLPHYEGAVRHAAAAAAAALAGEEPPIRPASAPSALTAGEEVQRVEDPRALEALTNQNGFMGFEYVGG